MPNKINSFLDVLKAGALVLFSGIIYAVAIKYFIMPSKVIMTGSEGIALATSYFYSSERLFVLLYAIFQTALIIFSFVKIGWIFSTKTILTILTIIVLLLILPDIKVASPEPENERLLLVLFGAIIAGIGKVVSFLNRGSTGDEDIVSVYFSEKLRKPVGKISIFAGVISTVYGLILNFVNSHDISIVANTLIYTVIYIFVGAFTVNTIYKRYRYSNIMINSENPEEVIKIIKSILPERTYTRISGTGGYSSKERTLISIIVTQEELPQIIRSIEQMEGNYFLYHSEIDGIKGRFTYSKIR
ncbi:YitT family protein [Sediminispirochaeta smaragdinae]|uniref:DUF2179 domain-containing protein n=1 Tax=Sediminispirochaeta smaragdinae (strain DSM 11293 / JCM 15392 / SEBR 4228) TaxID=573413 RepID=E1R1I7_SEDSS|nr:YitT family protein [Sediminispirochaeta smaragdinae]ADK81128.1 Protein of unknown function DUF2179 [Sediminispirochaeta smaragdinae DSM 11293]